MSDQPNKSNRRSFLTGQSALDAIRSKIDETDLRDSDGSSRAANSKQSGYLEQYSKNAMGCEFEILFNLHQYVQSGAAAMEAFQLVDLLEDQMTVYREHSAICHINREAFENAISVEARLFELLIQSFQIYEETSHAFDITASPLTEAWGFDKRRGSVPSQDRIDEALVRVGSSELKFDQDAKSIQFLKPGVELNLGGIGKGHALDRIAELFECKKIENFVVHGGQSSVVARGSSSSDGGSGDSKPSKPEAQSDGWKVGLSHPTVPGLRLAEIRLNNQALGTSGSGRQGFFHNGKRYGHIIDPRTGWPASHFLSTTVISNSAALSDALATAFFVMSAEEIQIFCENRPDVSAVLVSENDQQKGQLSIETFNLSDADFEQVES
jgi:thiamine biosynthesis lipoprotein